MGKTPPRNNKDTVSVSALKTSKINIIEQREVVLQSLLLPSEKMELLQEMMIIV